MSQPTSSPREPRRGWRSLMERPTERPTKRLVERLVDGRLPALPARWVAARLERDEGLRAYYDDLRRVQRAAAGHPPLSSAQAAHVKARLFAGLPQDAPATSPARGWRRARLALVGAACAALLFLLVGRPAPPDEGRAHLVPRGTASEPGAGVRVRCLAPSRDRVLDVAEGGAGPAVSPPELACPPDGLLSFSATHRGEAPLYLFVVGVAPPGELRWYAPFSRGSRSVQVPAGAIDHVMGSLASLAGMPDDGRVALFAVFSRAPLEGDEVARAVRGARREGRDPSRLPRLPLDPLEAVEQVRIDLVTDRSARP